MDFSSKVLLAVIAFNLGLLANAGFLIGRAISNQTTFYLCLEAVKAGANVKGLCPSVAAQEPTP